MYYIHSDHLGGSAVVTNSNTSTTELMDYYPYGVARLDEKATTFSEQRKFGGHEYDPLSAYLYLGARYYNPAVGRFLSEDPSFLSLGDKALIKRDTKMDQQKVLENPQSLNSYAFAEGNPIKNVDLDGKYVEVSVGGTAMGFSGSIGLRFDLKGIDVFAAGGSGIGIGGGPTISVNGADLSHKTESTVSVGASFTTPAGGVAIDYGGVYNHNTVNVVNPSTQKSATFGRLGIESYIRKEYSIGGLFGGYGPDGLKLTTNSSFSTPNYQLSPSKTNNPIITSPNQQIIGPVINQTQMFNAPKNTRSLK